jgi:hypothetical protein
VRTSAEIMSGTLSIMKASSAALPGGATRL